MRTVVPALPCRRRTRPLVEIVKSCRDSLFRGVVLGVCVGHLYFHTNGCVWRVGIFFQSRFLVQFLLCAHHQTENGSKPSPHRGTTVRHLPPVRLRRRSFLEPQGKGCPSACLGISWGQVWLSFGGSGVPREDVRASAAPCGSRARAFAKGRGRGR